MDEVVTIPVESVAPAAPAAGWQRVVRWPLAPFRFARRRPLRALGVGVAALVVTLGAAVGGLLLWFDYHLAAARREVQQGHNASAVRHLRSCQWVRPEQRDVLILAARVSRRSGAWAEAEILLDKYSARHGDDGPLVLERLLLRATRGELESAVPQLSERIARAGPEAALSREAIVTGLQYRFRWVEANRVLDEWLALTPESTVALLLRGKLQEQRLQTSEALLTFRRILELDPEYDEARMRLATILLSMRQGEEAATHAGYLRHRLPANPEVRMQWVRALGLQGRTAEARAALDDCLRAHPDYPAALAERGRYAVQDGEDAAAEEYLGRAARFDPGNFATRHQLSLVLARNGKKAEADAAQAVLRSLEVDTERINTLIQGPLQSTPNDPAVHHEIGLIALRSGQPTEALRWFLSAAQVGPDHLPTHQTLAAYYHEIGNPVLEARHRAIAQNLSRRK